MDRTGQLNDRQLEVLKAIGDGDDLSDAVRVPYRRTARALQDRGLVTIKRNKQSWSASVTDDGRFYLEHGFHPRRDVPKRQYRPAKPSDTTRSTTARTAPTRVADSGETRARRAPKWTAETAARRRDDATELIQRLKTERCVVFSDAADEEVAKWRKTIDFAKRHDMVPAGHIIVKYRSGPDLVIELSAARHPNQARKLAEGLPEVPIPSSLRGVHKVVAALRDDRDQLGMPDDQRRRALLILHALTAEAVGRGYKVTGAPPHRRHRIWHHGRSNAPSDGELTIVVDGYSFLVTLKKQYPQSDDPHRSSLLKITLSGVRRSARQDTWTDRKTWSLEQQLPAVLDELAFLAVAEKQRQIDEWRAEAERRLRWEAAMTEATRLAHEEQYATVLRGQAKRWHDATALRAYCDALEQHLADTEPGIPARTAAAREWLTWARAYIESIDPLHDLPVKPETHDPEPDELKPFLGKWSPYSPESRRYW